MSRKYFKRLVDKIKKIELNGYVHDFSIDYDAIAVDDTSKNRTYIEFRLGLISISYSSTLRKKCLHFPAFRPNTERCGHFLCSAIIR